MKTRIALTACLVGLVVLLGADLVSAARPKDKAPDRIDQLMQRFQALDANGDGKVTADEWRRAHGGGGPRAAGERPRAKAAKPGATHDPERLAARLKNLSPDERREAFRKLPPETQKKLRERFRRGREKANAPARKGAAQRNFRNMTPDQRREAISKLPPEKREKLGALRRQRQGGQFDGPQALRQGLMKLRQMSPEERRQAIQNLPPKKRRQVADGTPRSGRGGAWQQGPQREGPRSGGRRRMMMGPRGGQYGAPQHGFGGRGGAWQQGPQRRGPRGGRHRRMMMGPRGGQYGAPQRGFGGRGGGLQQNPRQANPQHGGRRQQNAPLSEQDISDNWDLLMDLDLWR